MVHAVHVPLPAGCDTHTHTHTHTHNERGVGQRKDNVVGLPTSKTAHHLNGSETTRQHGTTGAVAAGPWRQGMLRAHGTGQLTPLLGGAGVDAALARAADLVAHGELAHGARAAAKHSQPTSGHARAGGRSEQRVWARKKRCRGCKRGQDLARCLR